MNTKNKKILIVDDEADILTTFSNRLRLSGYQVVTASEGREALEKVDFEKPDLILLDLMMPGIDGFSVLETLKSDPKRKRIPVIITSVKFHRDSIDKAAGLGADDYLSKPFVSSDLLRKIEKLLA
jgi:CheY-like chemotaxis protein